MCRPGQCQLHYLESFLIYHDYKEISLLWLNSKDWGKCILLRLGNTGFSKDYKVELKSSFGDLCISFLGILNF